MGLTIQTIQLHKFRNFEDFRLSLSPQITILHGRNAVGKTNTIEALQLVTTGTSFKKANVADLIQQGANKAHIHARLVGDERLLDVELFLEKNKRFLVNGKARRSSDVAGTLMSVLFCPDDLLLVKGSARARRDEIDSFGSQASRPYRKLVQAYHKTIEQRNRLLKDEYLDVQLLDAWDESLAIGAGSLLFYRLSLFYKIKAQFILAAQDLVPADYIDLEYSSSAGKDLEALNKEQLIERMRKHIEETRNIDLRRQQTTVGPHRDDFVFLLDNKDARDYGSQGQQRALVLAWKMALLGMAEKISGSPALLLLDDVMSELDDIRRSAVLSFLDGKVQTVISTTNLGYFSGDELKGAEVVAYE